jgi:hypothetical protein
MIPLVQLLDDPNENEVKLFNMIKTVQRALEGINAPLAGWGSSSGPEGDGGPIVGDGSGPIDINTPENVQVETQTLTQQLSLAIPAGASPGYSWSWVGPGKELYVLAVDRSADGGNAIYTGAGVSLLHILDGVITTVPKVPSAVGFAIGTTNCQPGKADEPMYAFFTGGSGYISSVWRNKMIVISLPGGDAFESWCKYGNRIYAFPQLFNNSEVLREYDANTGGAALRSSSAIDGIATGVFGSQATENYLWALSNSKIYKIERDGLTLVETIDLGSIPVLGGVVYFHVVPSEDTIYFVRIAGTRTALYYWKNGSIYTVDDDITMTDGGSGANGFPFFGFSEGNFYMASRFGTRLYSIGTVQGVGQSRASEILILGENGQITADSGQVATIDTVNKRIGVNTGAPSATLDVRASDKQDVPLIALRTGSMEARADMYLNGVTSPNARYKALVTTSPATRHEFWSMDAAGVLAARALVGELVDITGSFALSGDLTPAQITVSQNDYNPTGLSAASILRLNSTGAVNITGLAGGADGRVMVAANVGANNITLVDESASSAAANRFALLENLALAADAAAILFYDSTSSRWRSISTPPHNLLSATHPDTLAASVVRGDLIVGNSTPKWSRFAVGANNTLLKSNGTDPSWLDYTTDWLSQYALLAGRAGGQTLKGGTAAGDDLTLMSTNHATKGSILFGTSAYDEVNNRLGIGLTSPFHKMHIQTDGVNCGTLADRYGTNTTSSFMAVRTARGTPGTPAAVQAGDILGTFYFQGRFGTTVGDNDIANGAEIAAIANQNFSSGATGTYLSFRTTSDGAGGNTERLRIGAAGTFGFNSAPSTTDQLFFTSLSGNYASFAKFVGTMANNGGDIYCLNFVPGIQPTVNTNFVIGTFSHPVAQPASGVTITNFAGVLARSETGSTAGAVTSSYALFADAFYGTLKPTNSYGVFIGQAGATGITNTSALYLTKPTNSTNNWYITFDTADGTALGAYSGRLAINVAGNTRYIPYYL